jgi:hypothetical protein
MSVDSSSSKTQQDEATSFQSRKWVEYFDQNKLNRPVFDGTREIVLEESLRDPLIRSLQRFQIGEIGDGEHLKTYARQLQDPAYLHCVDLFVREEQIHGQVIGEVILALDGSLLTWHWTQIAFFVLRRMLGLKTEVLVLLIAEVIGKCFYKCVSETVPNTQIRELFAVIVIEEVAHLHFHSEFLSYQLRTRSRLTQAVVQYVWFAVFYVACIVFVLDHRSALRSMNIAQREFIAKCAKEFWRSAEIVFGQRREPQAAVEQ